MPGFALEFWGVFLICFKMCLLENFKLLAWVALYFAVTGAFFCGHSERSALIQFGRFSSCLCTQGTECKYFQCKCQFSPCSGSSQRAGKARKTSPKWGAGGQVCLPPRGRTGSCTSYGMMSGRTSWRRWPGLEPPEEGAAGGAGPGTSAPPLAAVASGGPGAQLFDLVAWLADLHTAGLETPTKPLWCPAAPAPGQWQRPGALPDPSRVGAGSPHQAPQVRGLAWGRGGGGSLPRAPLCLTPEPPPVSPAQTEAERGFWFLSSPWGQGKAGSLEISNSSFTSRGTIIFSESKSPSL